jgi:multidrug resistance efflux pump
MLEFFLCSLVTILPDYLYRSRIQGKRWGEELNLFSIWYELRWGISSCAILTISLITAIFYFHPSTSNVSSFFRTVTILSEAGGRVEEVYAVINTDLKAGDPILRLESSTQIAAVDAAQSKVSEVKAGQTVALSERAAAAGMVAQAQASLQQTQDELARNIALRDKGSAAFNRRDEERLENLRDVRSGAVDSAQANIDAIDARINTLLPAQLATAQASLAQAQAVLDKQTVYAGVDGRIQQFTLRPGDYINPILRPAGILVPADAGRGRFQAGFGQISAQVLKPGMVAEMGCISHPFTIIPMVITEVQDVIPAGQIRPSDTLVDPQNLGAPGGVTVFMEPLYPGQTDVVPPGSRCIANAYTSNHDRLASGELSAGQWVAAHVVDTVGVVHAIILRIQMLLLPVQVLVFSDH